MFTDTNVHSSYLKILVIVLILKIVHTKTENVIYSKEQPLGCGWSLLADLCVANITIYLD